MTGACEETCPVCEEGVLVPQVFDQQVQYGKLRLTVSELERSRCSACGADPLLPAQIRRNQQRLADAKRRATGLLTGGEIRATRELLGLSQPEAAKLFGGGANAFSKYERGEVIQSESMDSLLRVVAANPWLLVQLRMRNTRVNEVALSANEPRYVDEKEADVSVVVRRSSVRGGWTLVSRTSWKTAA